MLTNQQKVTLRQKVVQLAENELGARDPRMYWYLATGAQPSAAVLKLAWCGAFMNAMMILAGVTKRHWIFGKGIIFSQKPYLGITTKPQPGDVIYVDKPYQHYAIVTSTDTDGTIRAIGGNTPTVARQSFNPSKVQVYSIEQWLDNEATPPGGTPVPTTNPNKPNPPPAASAGAAGFESLPGFTACYDALVHQLQAAGHADGAAHKAAVLLMITGVETGGAYASHFSTARDAYLQHAGVTAATASEAQLAAADKNQYAANHSNNLHGTQFAGGEQGATEFIDFFYAIDHHADGTPYVARFRKYASELDSHMTTLRWLLQHTTAKAAMATCAPAPVVVRAMKADRYFEGDVDAYTKLALRHAKVQLPYLAKSAAAVASRYPNRFDPLGVSLPTVYWFVGYYDNTGAYTASAAITSPAHSVHQAHDQLSSQQPVIAAASKLYVSARYPGADGWTAITSYVA